MQDHQEMYDKAAQYRELKEYDKAIEIYDTLLNQNPSDEIALGELMDLYFSTDKCKYYITRANLNIVQNLTEHAINDYRKALNVDPANANVRFALGTLLEATGKNLKAIDEYLKVLDYDTQNPEVYTRLAGLYMMESSPNSAIETLQRGADNLSENRLLKNELSKVYFSEGNFDKALEITTDLKIKAKILLQKEDNDKAYEIIEQLSVDADYYVLLSQYFYNVNNPEKCLNAIQNYEKQAKGIKGANTLIFQMKALLYEKNDEKSKAHYFWGLYNKSRERFETALSEFLAAYQFDKNDKNNLVEIAKMYSKIGERYPSIEFWEKVYEIDKDDEARQILGEFYLEQGDTRKAEKFGVTSPKGMEACQDEGFLNKIMYFFTH